MNLVNYCNTLFNMNYCRPCFLVDVKTNEIIYQNTAMNHLLSDIPKTMWIFFYKMIMHQGNNIIVNAQTKDSNGKLARASINNNLLNLKFEINEISFELNGRVHELYIYTCLKELNDTTPTFEGAMNQYIEILKQDEDTIIPAYLEVLGKFYNAEKAHYYSLNYEKNQISHEYSWKKNENIVMYPELNEKIDVRRIFDWIDKRSEVNILECDAGRKDSFTDEIMNEIIEIFNIDNMVLSVIEDENHKIMGIIGISNRENKDTNFRFLRIITKLIEVNLHHKNLQDTLRVLQETDLLTEFYTRAQYLQTLHLFEESMPSPLGVLYIHINDLKKINMESGFINGDNRIKHASKVLKSYFNLDFYRVSGNKFIAFYPFIDKKCFENEMREFQNYLLDKEETSFTLGYAWAEKNYKLLHVIHEAERQMYVNKQKYYKDNSLGVKASSIALKELLVHIENQDFEIYLQPQVYLKDRSLHGAEALIRRYDKEKGRMIPPDQFIPLYEKNLIIRHIDIYVIEKVCQLLECWHREGKAIPISVNISRITLLEHGIIDVIMKICDKHKIPHHLLVIEITEQADMIEVESLSEIVLELKDKGFKTSLDDFGCAYSNIVTLAQVAVDEVKIDKSLMDKVIVEEKNAIIVKNILTMCHEINGIQTLAEGIETQEQADMLLENHCLLGQGYLYSRPLPIETFYEAYIK